MRVNDSAKKRIYQENTTWEQDSKCNETDIKTRRVWDDIKHQETNETQAIDYWLGREKQEDFGER